MLTHNKPEKRTPAGKLRKGRRQSSEGQYPIIDAIRNGDKRKIAGNLRRIILSTIEGRVEGHESEELIQHLTNYFFSTI